MAASASTDSTERSMWPAMMTSARPIAMMPTKVDCSMMLTKMPIWKKFGIEEREDDQHDDQDEPDEVVEHEFDRARWLRVQIMSLMSARCGPGPLPEARGVCQLSTRPA